MRDQTRLKLLVAALVLFVFQTALMPPLAKAGDRRELERKIDALEAANRALEEKSRAIEDQLRQQTEEVNHLKQDMATVSQLQAVQQDNSKLWAKMTSTEGRPTPVQVGFMVGYAESPYDMPGGLFYGAYLRHELLTQEDGVPAGTITGELMAGAIMGNSVVTTGNLATKAGLMGPGKTWVDTVEIQPTAQYHLNLDAVGLSSIDFIKPYILGGPAIWVDLMSTPVTNTGSIPGERFRHGSGEVQLGGVYGVGFQVSLGNLRVPAIQGILDRASVGAEWRYNQMANGEQFQQYAGSIALGL